MNDTFVHTDFKFSPSLLKLAMFCSVLMASRGKTQLTDDWK